MSVVRHLLIEPLELVQSASAQALSTFVGVDENFRI